MRSLEPMELPTSWTEGKIFLIPKAGKDQTQPQSHWPITLLNIDFKILTTIIAGRPNGVLTKCIHLDQMGFLKNRQLGDNVTRVLNLIDYVAWSKESITCYFMYAEKVFDRVEWDFIMSVTAKWGLGSFFMQWISISYSFFKKTYYLSKLLLQPGLQQLKKMK